MSEFEKFCKEKEIRGNFKEALYRALCADYGMERVDTCSRAEVEVCWQTVLFQILDEMKR